MVTNYINDIDIQLCKRKKYEQEIARYIYFTIIPNTFLQKNSEISANFKFFETQFFSSFISAVCYQNHLRFPLGLRNYE